MRACLAPLVSVAVKTYPRCARRGQLPERRPELGVNAQGFRVDALTDGEKLHVRCCTSLVAHDNSQQRTRSELTARRLVITFVPGVQLCLSNALACVVVAQTSAWFRPVPCTSPTEEPQMTTTYRARKPSQTAWVVIGLVALA